MLMIRKLQAEGGQSCLAVGRRGQSLPLQWEEGVTVLIGSGLLKAAWARLREEAGR